MSRFSGKFDLYDDLFMIRDFDLDYVKRSHIYVGFTMEQKDDGTFYFVPDRELHIESVKDLVPYFPYVESMSSRDKDHCIIYLMDKSWVDVEEEKYGHSKIRDYYREELRKEMEKYGCDMGKERQEAV